MDCQLQRRLDGNILSNTYDTGSDNLSFTIHVLAVCPDEPNFPISSIPGTRRVDKLDIGSGCEQNYAFPVEGGVFRLVITIEVEHGKPQLTLLDDNRKMMSFFVNLIVVLNYRIPS